MKRCVNCGSPLELVERLAIVIDVCPICHGVWLDRGELEKMLLHARSTAAPAADLPSRPRQGLEDLFEWH